MKSKVIWSSNRMNWATPQEFYNELNKTFQFTLDPCADDLNHKCDKYYTKAQDGLSQDWSYERVFCNPPYGRDLKRWVKKSYDEVYNGRCPLVVMLIPARTDTKWFHDYVYHQAEVRFIKGRLRFSGADQPAPFPSMLVVFRGME